MYNLVIFDMDGTIANTSLGILNSHRYAHKFMGRPIPSDEILKSVIGGPLLQTYTDRFGFSLNEAKRAVSAYRDYYSRRGLNETVLYPGIEQTLETLFNNGIHIAMATLKAESFAKTMLKNMGIFEYFDVVYGMNDQDTRTKSQLINMCIDSIGCKKENSLMVGDSIHDFLGSEASCVPFLAVTYGFGFRPEDILPFPCVNSTEQILSAVLDSHT